MAHKITDHAVIRYCQRVLGKRTWTVDDYFLARECLMADLKRSVYLKQQGRKTFRQFENATFVIQKNRVITVEI